MKSEIEHKLDLIKIHKKRIDLQSENIKKLGIHAPVHMKLEVEEEREEVKSLFKNVTELIQELNNTEYIVFEQKLKELSNGKLEGNDIYLGIAIIQKVLDAPLDQGSQNLLKNAFGNTINIIDSKNIIINSEVRTENDLHLGDKTD